MATAQGLPCSSVQPTTLSSFPFQFHPQHQPFPFKVVACDFLLAIKPCSAVQHDECIFFFLLSVGLFSKIWLVLDVQRGEDTMGGGSSPGPGVSILTAHLSKGRKGSLAAKDKILQAISQGLHVNIRTQCFFHRIPAVNFVLYWLIQSSVMKKLPHSELA